MRDTRSKRYYLLPSENRWITNNLTKIDTIHVDLRHVVSLSTLGESRPSTRVTTYGPNWPSLNCLVWSTSQVCLNSFTYIFSFSYLLYFALFFLSSKQAFPSSFHLVLPSFRFSFSSFLFLLFPSSRINKIRRQLLERILTVVHSEIRFQWDC